MILLSTTLSDSELARLTGVTRKTVRDWRIGRNAPTPGRAVDLAWLDLVARTFATQGAVLTVAGHRATVTTDADGLTTVTVDGHTATGWCGSGVCLLRLVSEAIRLAERQEVAP